MILKLLLALSLIIFAGCLRADVNPSASPDAIATISARASAAPTAIASPSPPIPSVTFEPTIVPTVGSECNEDSDCFVTGCSDTVCSSQEVFDICSYRQEYACYDMIECGCNNGVCAWNKTKLFESCVEDARVRQKEVFPPGLPYT